MSARGIVKIVKDVDPSTFEALRKRLISNAEVVKVGFREGIPHKSEHGSTSPYTVAQIAAVHEFGAPEAGIPERSFLRAGVNRNIAKYRALNRANILKVLKGERTIEQSLGLLGELAKGDVQAEIRNGDFEQLKDATIKRKGSSQPLIDSGQMRQSVDWELGNNND